MLLYAAPKPRGAEVIMISPDSLTWWTSYVSFAFLSLTLVLLLKAGWPFHELYNLAPRISFLALTPQLQDRAKWQALQRRRK